MILYRVGNSLVEFFNHLMLSILVIKAGTKVLAFFNDSQMN